MARYFRVPFADSGDKTTLPDETSTSIISYATGYSQDYQRNPATDPLARRPERNFFNQLIFDITDTLKNLYETGTVPFITSAMNNGSPFSYPIGARVILSNRIYENTSANNTGTPPAAGWLLVDVVGMDARYLNESNNLSDLPNTSTARTNLSVRSNSESDARYLIESNNLSDLTNTDSAINNLDLVFGNSSSNTRLGSSSLPLSTTGLSNTAVGRQAMAAATTGESNTAVGVLALSSITTTDSSTAVGRSALSFTTTGESNTAVGRSSMSLNTEGGTNTAIGTFSLENNTTGNSNTAVGYQSLESNNGSENTSIGYESLLNSSNIDGCVSIGYRAGRDNNESNRLFIANTNSKSLIEGDFNQDWFSINGELRFNGVNVGLGSNTDFRLVDFDDIREIGFYGYGSASLNAPLPANFGVYLEMRHEAGSTDFWRKQIAVSNNGDMFFRVNEINSRTAWGDWKRVSTDQDLAEDVNDLNFSSTEVQTRYHSYGSSTTNAPTTESGTVTTITRSTSPGSDPQKTQTAITSGGNMYVRVLGAGTWRAWRQVQYV